MKKNKLLFLFAMLFSTCGLFAQYQYVGTYTGSQTAGYLNGNVSGAKYNYPYGVTFDGNNTIYVADLNNHAIRRIDITTGTVSTLAGSGSAGFVDSIGVLAKFNSPTGVYYKNGFVYVSDNLNNSIRKIDVLSNEVTTVAGTGGSGLVNGAALSSTFYQPKSLVVNDSGDVFVADYENHVIRKISNGVVTTYAGTGAVSGYKDSTLLNAKFWRPRDLTIDPSGNIYVTDLMNNRIRKISGNQVTTFAGSGIAGGSDGNGLLASFNIPTGIEFYAGNLYVTDGVGNKVRKISLSGNVTTIAGSGATGFINGNCASAQFNLMQDLTIDNNGQIYIGDRNNNMIRIIASSSNLFSGHVFSDESSNCVKDIADRGFSNWIIKAMPGSYYSSTDSNGYYTLPLPAGTYTISQIIPNPFFWDTICPSPNYTRIVTASTGTFLNNIDFALHARVNCAMLSVDVASAALRRCITNNYYARYSNIGNDTATNAYVEIQLDSLMTMASPSIPVASQTGNTYRFNVGDLLPGETGIFYFGVTLSCSATMGSTWCVKALIGPQGNCAEPIDSTWDRSSVSVNGTCNDSLACFTIINNGSSSNGNMNGSSEFRIYENGILVYAGTFQLLGGQDTVICWPGNGNTIQLQADQRPGHPGHSHPNDFVEDCGTPSGSSPVFGIATATSPDDVDEFVEIECLQVIGSFDPNDKTVIPAGIGTERYIDLGDELEYRIRFQNTGNDTAFNIFVIDTLTAYLDPTTVISGVSSHPYTFSVIGNGILKWTFSNILLPDSTTNEPGSHGFVKFKIKQTNNILPGTLIENKVGIYFDFNEPVITNTAFNTIRQEQVIHIHQIEKLLKDVIMVFPNPSSGVINFESKLSTKWNLKITDVLGKIVQNGTFETQKASVDLSSYPKGVYFYQIVSEGNIVGFGKIVIQ